MKQLPVPTQTNLLRAACVVIVILALAAGYYATKLENLQQRTWRLERLCQTAKVTTK